MPDQVSEETVRRGFDRLLRVVQETAREQSVRWLGKDEYVLVESVNEQHAELLTGRMSNNTLVHFPGDAALIGQFVSVHLDECHGFYYMGTMLPLQ